MKTSFSNQLVTIKGTKEGLVIHLDDKCSYAELIQELKEKMTESRIGSEHDKGLHVHVRVGKRYVDVEERREIQATIEQPGTIIVSDITSEVMTKTEALEIKEDEQTHSYARLVRSGQVLSVKGDLLILGDVNPGGTVEASGDIYVLGALKGTARAGVEGDEAAVIAASVLLPAQLMIADRLYLTSLTRTERAEEAAYAKPRYACIKQEEIVFNHMSSLATLRKQRTANA
ncbi:septum site-determining protein MinC [Natribacillus halophilus]|uniref:Probable septum site-determining protein MinC n=1 Tax=Natribacillus halophilus TaxID=549003 RepID=A0A1G8LR58_9BACI|nr:septum site-determining protein MinC [Natribacillus halophilus]SDI58201.1 septum site-determining protein MinC [Natribacillus halophilus]